MMREAARHPEWRQCMVTLGMAAAMVCGPTAVPRAATALDALQIKVLSNRADLISGGDALVEIVLPAKVLPTTVRVSAGGRDVTSVFALRSNGRFMGLVT